MIGIYKIISPTGRVYIGQSTDVERRLFIDYKDIHRFKSQVRLYNSLLKYGYSAHVFEVVEECKVEELNIRERYWQEFYNVLGDKGLNCKLQGAEGKSGKMSEETKVKMSLAKKGKRSTRVGYTHSEEVRRKMSEACKGRAGCKKGFKHSEETREKMRNKVVTGDHRSNISKALTGRKLSEEHKEKIKAARRLREQKNSIK